MKESADGGYITQTNITIVANRTDHGADYMCRASNAILNEDAIASVSLDVLCKLIIAVFTFVLLTFVFEIICWIQSA